MTVSENRGIHRQIHVGGVKIGDMLPFGRIFMKDNAMQIALILDRSGSMSTIAGATVEGVNAFLAEQKNSPTDVSIRFVQFDDVYEEVYDGKINDAPLLTLSEPTEKSQKQFVPRGWTALLDAIGTTITDVGKRLNDMPESERPTKVVVVIMTDGMENRSKKYSQDQIANLIQQQRDVYKWEFQYLGANQDAIATADKMHIPFANAVTFAASAVGTMNVMRSASRNVRNYGITGQAATMDYSAEDRAKAMEEDKPATAKP
jgi:hypothetical protein